MPDTARMTPWFRYWARMGVAFREYDPMLPSSICARAKLRRDCALVCCRSSEQSTATAAPLAAHPPAQRSPCPSQQQPVLNAAPSHLIRLDTCSFTLGGKMSLPGGGGRGSIRLPSSSPPSLRTILSDSLSRLSSIRSGSDLRRLLSKSYGPLPNTPLFVRPAYVCLLGVTLVCLSVLGFHPTLAGKISPPVPWWDKVLHFVGMGLATGLFYGVWRVGEEGRRGVWWWRLAPELLCAVVCLAGE